MRAKVFYRANGKPECCEVVFPHGLVPRKGEWLRLEGAGTDYTYVIQTVTYVVRGSNGEPIDDVCYDIEISVGSPISRKKQTANDTENI